MREVSSLQRVAVEPASFKSSGQRTVDCLIRRTVAKEPRKSPDFACASAIAFRAESCAPVIASPVNGTEYLISKKDPEPLQLVAKTSNDVSKVYWYINNKFYKSCNAGEKQFFVPEEGPVKISCTDDKGRNRDIWITVKYVSL